MKKLKLREIKSVAQDDTVSKIELSSIQLFLHMPWQKWHKRKKGKAQDPAELFQSSGQVQRKHDKGCRRNSISFSPLSAGVQHTCLKGTSDSWTANLIEGSHVCISLSKNVISGTEQSLEETKHKAKNICRECLNSSVLRCQIVRACVISSASRLFLLI